MKVTARDLKELGLIEQIIPEKEPACAETLPELASYMDKAMAEFFETYRGMEIRELTERRYKRFRRM